jgi:hypothetical protein
MTDKCKCGRDAHYLSRWDGEMRCGLCQGEELSKPGHLLNPKGIKKKR